MIIERRSGDRGRVQAGWLDSRHTFSFGHFYDPAWMGFGVLRVINEDRVAPGEGFPTHGHANMEILSYVLEGALAHKDSTGGGGVIRPGELQWMGAGHGVEHSEFNGSDTEPVHFLQIWIQPDRVNAEPGYAQREVAPPVAGGGWTLLASPDGIDGSLSMRQDARVLEARLGAGESAGYPLDPGRRYWLHLARGSARVGGRELRAGDALGYSEESGSLELKADDEVLALLFDLPG
ncbi:pirin family protein [Marilutibacter alkalisoli]|uniref:Pirin family protein n=1 Tax=Marilutibacter alkalisoli TaxID=2591633 RepID=A0A514BNW4_9GAMM|nr:pirin family protein [Lysobacter alkalisoli]QDH69087.1 pirin family protein [Lysobacter alkalisoli]